MSKNYYLCYLSEQSIETEEEAELFMKNSINFGLGKNKEKAKESLEINVSAYECVKTH